MQLTRWKSIGITLTACAILAGSAVVRTEARPKPQEAPKANAGQVTIDPDDIGGVVTSANGPEAGVWVIAETTELPTKFRRIVVTDDKGRYVLPDLPKANYKIWVRGYGLVDSKAVESAPGKHLDLAAVVAPTVRAAAEYYPGSYWYSLIKIPPKSEFPMKIRNTSGSEPEMTGANEFGRLKDDQVHTQAQWLFLLKRGCEVCHQMGNKATRELPKNLGTFDSPALAWERRMMSGQVGPEMTGALNNFGHDRGLAMFADWSTRIEKGEVPPAPPRPVGVERNVVISLWDFGTDKSFFHDVVSTDERNPTVNGYGPVYGADFSAGSIAVVDPIKNTEIMFPVPLRNDEDRKDMKPFTSQHIAKPSPYWGNEIVWNDRVTAAGRHMDDKGRVWVHAQTRKDQPAYCREGSNNPFAKNFPMPANLVARGNVSYDPKTKKFDWIDTCLPSGHEAFDTDKDRTLYFSSNSGIRGIGAIGWSKTRLFDETHDSEKVHGWCPVIIDYNGDGKIGAYTRPNEPADPALDMAVPGASGYGIDVSPIDHTIWYAGGVASSSTEVPGKIIHVILGSNPPETCISEVFEPPFNNPKRPGVEAFSTLGITIDSKGLVWAALAGSNDLASFDRSKCKGPMNGPKATGQHCPEGWTLYPVPGPYFKGTKILADSFYHNWVDRFGTLGLGNDVPIVTGTGSDSLIAFLPQTKKFITMRLPYPMGFYMRGMDGRIDDPKAGWKGRGVWTSNQERVIWHVETGKGSRSFVAHFQVRPNPLAK